MYERERFDLYWFIYHYVPKGWKENIGAVDHVPRLTEREYSELKDSNVDDLEISYAAAHCGTWRGKHYMIDAIKAYFIKKKGDDDGGHDSRGV